MCHVQFVFLPFYLKVPNRSVDLNEKEEMVKPSKVEFSGELKWSVDLTNKLSWFSSENLKITTRGMLTIKQGSAGSRGCWSWLRKKKKYIYMYQQFFIEMETCGSVQIRSAKGITQPIYIYTISISQRCISSAASLAYARCPKVLHGPCTTSFKSFCVPLLSPEAVNKKRSHTHSEMSWISDSQAQQGGQTADYVHAFSPGHLLFTSHNCLSLARSLAPSQTNLMLCFSLLSKSSSKWLTLMNACKRYAAGRIWLQAKLVGREKGIRGRNRRRDSL